jgi:hypothetical protein
MSVLNSKNLRDAINAREGLSVIWMPEHGWVVHMGMAGTITSDQIVARTVTAEEAFGGGSQEATRT